MRENLDATGGLIASEAVMMALAPHLGRDRAHDLVAEISRRAIERKKSFLDLLANDPEVSQQLDRASLANLVDPANYLGLAGAMVDRVLQNLEKQ